MDLQKKKEKEKKTGPEGVREKVATGRQGTACTGKSSWGHRRIYKMAKESSIFNCQAQGAQCHLTAVANKGELSFPPFPSFR